MENIIKITKVFSGAIAAVCTALWGKPDAWLYALLACVALDYITGIAAAYVTKTLSSEIGFRGLLKKMLLLLIVALANTLDNLMGMGGVLRSLVIGFYIANEGLSLLENAGRCGVPIPNKLMAALKQLQSDGDKTAK